jgi:hypothetical protein
MTRHVRTWPLWAVLNCTSRMFCVGAFHKLHVLVLRKCLHLYELTYAECCPYFILLRGLKRYPFLHLSTLHTFPLSQVHVRNVHQCTMRLSFTHVCSCKISLGLTFKICLDDCGRVGRISFKGPTSGHHYKIWMADNLAAKYNKQSGVFSRTVL